MFDDESLSSFLMRIAKAYYTSVSVVWKCYGHQRRAAYRVDLYSSNALDIKKICGHMNNSAEHIRSATFYNLIISFVEENDVRPQDFFGNLVEKKRRRFCPCCLAEQTYYPLLWQVNELKLCLKHSCYLEDSCPVCKSPIPYVADGLAEGKCPSCQSSLAQKIHYSTDAIEMQEQTTLYSEWNFMLSNKFTIHHKTKSLTKGRYVCAKLLFIAQGLEPMYNRLHITLKSKRRSELLRYVNGQKEQHAITLPFLRHALRTLGVRTEFFYETMVPDSYLKSIFNSEKVGPCLSPWCKSYRTAAGMISLFHKGRSFHSNYELLRSAHMCRHCSLKYGYNDSGVWVEKGEVISVAFYKCVPLLNAGFKISQIAKALGIDQYRVSLYAAYLVQYQLVNEHVISYYKRDMQDLEPLPYFQKIAEMKGCKSHLTKKLFNWNKREYLYHQWHPEVQAFFVRPYVNKKHLELRVKEEKQERSKVKSLESEVTLIWEKAKLIVIQLELDQITISDKDWYTKLGRGKRWIGDNMPDLREWYSGKKLQLKETYKKEQTRAKLNMAIKVMCKLFRSGLPLTECGIKLETGFCSRYGGFLAIQNNIANTLQQAQLTVEEIEEIMIQKPYPEEWINIINR
ncbi:TniQ family protein [Paenibacillus sp. FSL H7-0716]|uniref:TniQ family protein n=1 Tax=Paenibacillus TaxID=44249 RepID=UPI0015C30A3F|nr:TniQ family protein [Paenibacillus odorifer]